MVHGVCGAGSTWLQAVLFSMILAAQEASCISAGQQHGAAWSCSNPPSKWWSLLKS